MSGGTVVSTATLLKDCGFKPACWLTGASLCRVCMFSCVYGFSLGVRFPSTVRVYAVWSPGYSKLASVICCLPLCVSPAKDSQVARGDPDSC